MNHEQQNKSYFDTLTRISQGLAIGHNAVAENDIASEFTIDHIELFTSGNLDKRFDKLNDQLELLADVIDDLDQWISKYVTTVPLAAYDTGTSDGDRFIQWLTRETDLTAEQRDVGNVIRCRNGVEDIGRTNRLGHVRFQELRSLSTELGAELDSNSTLSIHLNPIRLWTTFETNLFVGDDKEEAAADNEFADSLDPNSFDAPNTNEKVDALFYAYENEVRTAVFEREAQIIFRALAEVEPCHLVELALRVDLAAGIDEATVREILVDSAEAGIVAFS